MMNEDRFWNLIAASRTAAIQQPLAADEEFFDRHCETLREQLRTLTPDEIVAFARRFNDLHERAYRWDLWGAAYWLGGGCGDDGFMDFRACLVSLGEADYRRALENPDSLADLVDRADVPYMQSEGIHYVAREVYIEKTGEESIPDAVENHVSPDEPLGEPFDFDDEALMAAHYPNLVAKLPDGGE